MHMQHHPIAAAALLLAGIAAFDLLIGWAVRFPPAPAPRTVRLDTVAWTALARCQEHVSIIHDVHWAAACMANADDTSPECTLPDARAAVLNAARSAAESRCLDDARAAR